MKKTPSLSAIAFSLSAVPSCNASLSTTHGPAMRNRGRSSPTAWPRRFMSRFLGEPSNDRHRRPVIKAVLLREILGEWLSRVDSSRNEHGVEAHSSGAEDVGLKAISYCQHL